MRNPVGALVLLLFLSSSNLNAQTKTDQDAVRELLSPRLVYGDFVKLHLYTSSQLVGARTIPTQMLADLMRSIAGTTENIGGIFFGIGSLLFFYLFIKSRYIPRMLSAVGLFASLIWIGLYFAKLIFPEHRAVFLYICGPPMLVADVATGF